MEGVEIVIKPRHIERVAYSLVIIALAVLLIIKWGGGGGDVTENETTAGVVAESGVNETDETANASAEADLCSNGIKDQDETDVDCGGDICDPCEEFKFCNIDSDCESGWCRGNVKCVIPTCDDNVKNQDESYVDCGGICGGYWYDNACHDEPKPVYSGRVDLSIIEVTTSIREFDDEEFAKVENVTFEVENGKEKDMIITIYIYGRDKYGMPYYESSITGDEIPMATVEIPLLSPGESYKETVVIKRTLTETDPDEEYSIVVEARDDDDKLLKEASWENTQ